MPDMCMRIICDGGPHQSQSVPGVELMYSSMLALRERAGHACLGP
jgi:hypothetical protein